MNTRVVAAAAALVLLAPPSLAAAAEVAEVDGSSIGLHAPKTAKPGKKFDLVVTMAFDAADIPPYGYLIAGAWQHRGDDACPKAVPLKSSGEVRSGWKNLYEYDYDPDWDGDQYELEWDTHLTRKPGTYRWCGYAYTSVSDGSMWGQAYATVARVQAKTIVRN